MWVVSGVRMTLSCVPEICRKDEGAVVEAPILDANSYIDILPPQSMLFLPSLPPHHQPRCPATPQTPISSPYHPARCPTMHIDVQQSHKIRYHQYLCAIIGSKVVHGHVSTIFSCMTDIVLAPIVPIIAFPFRYSRVLGCIR